MSDAIVRLRLDAGNYSQTLKSATRELQNTVRQVREMGATFAVTDKEETNFAQSFAKLATSATSTKQQLREITAAINDLKTAYAAMTGEERNSPFGKGLKDSIDQLIERAGILRDTMADTTQAINNAASDTRGFDQLIGAANVMTGAYGVLTAGAELFGVSTLSNSEAMRKLQTAIALCSSAQTLQNALQKQGAVYQGVLAVQARARAQAEALATSSTKAATVAQKAFNLVAKANPYALLATAIVAVGTALYAFTQKSKEASNVSGELSDKIKAQQSLIKGTADAASGNITEFEKLCIEWANLRTEAQQKQWIHDNQSAFERLGLSVNSISDAFDVFVRNKSRYIQAMTEIARASAYMDLAKAQFKKGIENSLKTTKAATAKAGDNVYTLSEDEQAFVFGNKKYHNTYKRYGGSFSTLTPAGAQALFKRRSRNALRAKDKQTEDINAVGEYYIQKALDSGNKAEELGLKSGGTSKTQRRRSGSGRTVAAAVNKPLTAEEKAELWRKANDEMQKGTHGLFNSSLKDANAAYNENVKRLSGNGAEYYAFRKLNELTPTELTPFKFQDEQGYKQSDGFKSLKFTESITKLRSGLDKVSDGISAGSSLVSNISSIITTLGGNSEALKTLTTVLGLVSAVIQVATTAIEVGAIMGLIPLSNRFEGNAGGLQGLVADGSIGGGQTLTATIKGEDIYLSNRNYTRRTGK